MILKNLAMLNILSNQDFFIIIGFEEIKDEKNSIRYNITGLEKKEIKEQNSINDYVDSHVFPSPKGYVFINNVEMENNKTIQIISFEGRDFKPYLKKDKGNIITEYYIRCNSSSCHATYL